MTPEPQCTVNNDSYSLSKYFYTVVNDVGMVNYDSHTVNKYIFTVKITHLLKTITQESLNITGVIIYSR
jgi:hypothetical protein